MIGAGQTLHVQTWYPTNPGFLTRIGADIDAIFGAGPRAVNAGIRAGAGQVIPYAVPMNTGGGTIPTTVAVTPSLFAPANATSSTSSTSSTSFPWLPLIIGGGALLWMLSHKKARR